MKRLLMCVVALGMFGSALAAETPAKSTAAKGAATTSAATKDKAIKQIDGMIASAKVDKSNPAWKTTLPKPTPASFDSAHSYYARMATNKGTLLIKFMPQVAPMHVTSFIYLARLGFYDGVKFHRVIPGFMAQGGDPLGTGAGGPGYEFAGEFSPAARHNRRGLLSTANRGPGTDGSQFFLTFVPYPSLDDKYTIYGEVVDGMAVLDSLEAYGSPGAGATTKPLKMEKVTIEVK
jgi:cyclophilin family peptidyl-prolyl cis-trans isomerase